jgi:hypothetical protein
MRDEDAKETAQEIQRTSSLDIPYIGNINVACFDINVIRE